MPKPITWSWVWLIIFEMKYYFLFGFLVAALSCQKVPQKACWKNSGEITNEHIPINSFRYLKLAAHIELELIQDSLDFIEWQAGANLQPFLKLTYSADTLSLGNANRCNFLRYKNGKVKAVLHFTSIDELHLENSEMVSNIGKWKQNELLIFLKEGVGEVALLIDVQKLSVRNIYGWQQLKLKGQSARLFVELDGSASINTLGLNVQDSIAFRSASLLSSYIWSDQIMLKAQLYGAGNLYYSGIPNTLLKTEYSKGRVLPKQ